jgi:transcriptional regulator with XRE-family HTH domain
VPAARDLDPGASPAHFYGAEVRHARTSAGMTLAELGALVPCDASTVSRIESGLLGPSERFAAACDEAFPNMNGWFTRFYEDSRTWAAPYPRWFADWVKAEREAVTLRTWEPLLIPGLLQTAEYARALFRAWSATGDEDEVEQLVTARLDRQCIFDRSKPPSFWAVMDEGVLRRCIGTPEVMQGQLLHLAEMTERPMIKVHVIPSEVGAHIGLLGAFAIAGFADDAHGIVYFESPDEGETSRDSATIAKIVLKFDTLRSEALPRGATRNLIMKEAEEQRRDMA